MWRWGITWVVLAAAIPLAIIWYYERDGSEVDDTGGVFTFWVIFAAIMFMGFYFNEKGWLP